ncbi:MAG: hypothetical protein AMXMBFR61_19710 [Fimbriimonadales bacterium]
MDSLRKGELIGKCSVGKYCCKCRRDESRQIHCTHVVYLTLVNVRNGQRANGATESGFCQESVEVSGGCTKGSRKYGGQGTEGTAMGVAPNGSATYSNATLGTESTAV